MYAAMSAEVAGSRLTEHAWRWGGQVVHISDCVLARDVSFDSLERMYEVTIYPHDEEDDEDTCPHLLEALSAIGPWAQFATPIGEVTDLRSGTSSFVIVPF